MDHKVATREAYGNALVRLGETYRNIVVLDADLSAATKTEAFFKKFPERAVNLGIAEQNMVGFAVGLAMVGYIPLASTFAVFAAGRAYDQIRQSVAYPKANVKIVATHGGLTVGEDGATHQSVEDLALMRALPNMTVIVPCDAVETEKAVEAAIQYDGPVYLRLGRERMPVIMPSDYQFKIGKAVTLKEGRDVTLIATGVMVYQALLAAELLKEKGVEAGVLNVHTLKPLDEEAIAAAALCTTRVVTAEEHSIIGGLGSAINDLIIRRELGGQVRVRNVGINDCFGQTGPADRLLKEYGLTAEAIASEALALM